MSHFTEDRAWDSPIINTRAVSRERRTGVTTSVVEEFAESRVDRLVSTNITQTIRARDITVTGENFKPLTRYYTFFDGISVASHMTPASNTYGRDSAGAQSSAKGSSLWTDTLGTLSVTFSIPNTDTLNFATGTKTLKVTDSSTNDPDSVSQGTAQYSANGEITTMQEEVISTRNGRVIIEEVSETRQRTIVTQRREVTWVDPLAESFLVSTTGGIFVTSVDLYFSVKDTSLPVTVQLRHMSNGSPTQKILPFGEKTISPASVNTSADASTSTKFTFPSPVFLESGNEYCVVVMTNSNTYQVWVSEMGGRDIATNDFIDQQPYAGSLFKSQNNSTWTPDQLRDLKMTLNRAKFTTSTQGNVVFNNGALAVDTLAPNSIESVYNTKTFKVHHYSHGNYDGQKSNITIAGVEADRSGSVFSFNDDTIETGDGGACTDDAQTLAQTSTSGSGTGLTATITTVDDDSTVIVIVNPGQGYVAGETVIFTKDSKTLTFTIAAVKDTLGGIPIEYINRTHTAGTGNSAVTDGTAKFLTDIDEYLITIPNSVWPTRTNGTATSPNYQIASESTTGGGESVTAGANAYFDTLHTVIPTIELPNTTVLTTFIATSAAQVASGSSYTKDTTSTTITLNDNNSLSTPKLVASSINETNEMGAEKSLTITTQLNSTADNVSPVLDVDTMGALAIQNRINNIDSSSDILSGTFVPSTLARGDNNAAVYMTKRAQLENAANAIHVLFDGYRAPDAGTDPEILVYYKVMGPDDNLQFNDVGWTLATIKSTVPADASDFKEYEYNIESLEDFTSFSIKVILQSANSANVPLIENFRAIALST